jgi:hypothetical protein
MALCIPGANGDLDLLKSRQKFQMDSFYRRNFISEGEEQELIVAALTTALQWLSVFRKNNTGGDPAWLSGIPLKI